MGFSVTPVQDPAVASWAGGKSGLIQNFAYIAKVLPPFYL